MVQWRKPLLFVEPEGKGHTIRALKVQMTKGAPPCSRCPRRLTWLVMHVHSGTLKGMSCFASSAALRMGTGSE